MRKNNILIISSRSEGGGAEQFFNIMTKLRDFFKFYCALPDSPPYYEKIVNGKIPTFKLPYRKFKIRAFFDLSKWVRRNGITVVHSHGGGAGVYSRLLKLFNMKLKVVHTFHGIHFRNINFILIVELLLRMLTNRFVFVSKSERQIALDYRITSVTKSVLIENGISIDDKAYKDIDRSSALQSFKITIPDKCFVIGMFSRFDSIKNIPYAIRNLADYIKSNDDVYVLIGGEGEERKRIECTIDEYDLSDKVVLLGFVEDIRMFFSLIDIYLNTSLGEAFGFSTVEAMKYGKPVVASKVYGNIDVVDDNKTGLLFSLDNPNLLVDKIKYLESNKGVYNRLVANARESVKNRFDLKRMLNETRELYLSLV